MESWVTSSVEDRESFSSIDDMGCTEVFSSYSGQRASHIFDTSRDALSSLLQKVTMPELREN